MKFNILRHQFRMVVTTAFTSSKSNTHSNKTIIVSAVRTPVGSFRGSLSSKSATSLGSIAIKGAIEHANIDNSMVEEVYMGNVLGSGLGQAPTKQAVMEAGLPESTICTTINKVCSSGLKSVMLASQSIELGHQSCIIAGGMESMSNAPYLLNKAREGYVYGNQQVLDSILKDGLWDAHYQCHMGDCAEETAAKYSISREEQDSHAIQSYTRASEAVKKGLFLKEIIPVSIEQHKKGAVIIVKEDEEYKKVNFEKVPNLKPAFKTNGEGTVTAANSSTLNDGASAVLLMNQSKLSSISGLKGMAEIIAYADAECNPKEFTIAPSLVIPKVLKMANLTIEDISLFEINEAFSVVVLANQKILKLNPDRVNIAGGAVSLGHPIGSSGCRILVTLTHLLKPGQFGCAAVCNGGGGSSAMIIRKL